MALVTGSSGQVGRAVMARLAELGWQARPFDLDAGADLRDEANVLAAVEGCNVIVHAGAIAHDDAGSASDIMATNLLGTWHVLSAAEQCGVSRVVYFSSGQVFGCTEGEGVPAYRPIDDDHPLRAARPYGLSKRLAEEMCAALTRRTGITTIILRPVMILDDDGVAATSEADVEFGPFVHLEDVADATVRAASVDISGHHRLILCGPGEFDTSRARGLLGWTPKHGW